jgi:hypothetical protein
MLNPYPCPQSGCNYPDGECSGACLGLAPASPRARHHGLPIDLVEPDAPALVGDRVPCHLFMPEVAWPDPVGPVIRMRPRREYWLLTRPVAPSTAFDDLSDLDSMIGVASLIPVFLCVTLLVAAGLLGWL